ncbi:MAG: hypothetical protein GF350_02760 [Chitinivibrionales bacterium]|nr:hypothetical protein [Chitinivibrionales bacterium]
MVGSRQKGETAIEQNRLVTSTPFSLTCLCMRIPPAVVLSAACLIFCCAGAVSQFYPDSYYTEDRTYVNKPLQFSLTYRGNWDIITDPDRMDRANKETAAALAQTGVELLYIGSTYEGTQATRGIAANLNLTSREYAEKIRTLMKNSIQEDMGLTEFMAHDKYMIKWQFVKSGFHFIEFFFTLDTYNIRIAFWTTPELMPNFMPVYEEILSTLTIISRY